MSGTVRTRPERTRAKLPQWTRAKRREMMRRLRAFEEDHVWVGEHYRELLTQYPEQWIAVVEGRVIASDTDLDSLIARIPDPGHTCIERITKDQVEIIL